MKARSQTALGALFVAAAGLTAAAPTSDVPTVHMPLHLLYGDNHKFATSLVLPYSGETIEVCYDLGSPDFFVFGADSTQNWGCPYLGCQGPCNASVPDSGSYDPSRSPTASAVQPWNAQYGYGGGLSKWYWSDGLINDTLTFTNGLGHETEVPDVSVALIHYLQQKVRDDGTCTTKPSYDYSILGMAPYFSSPDPAAANTTGPSFRQNLLERGQISAPVQSLWMEKPPADVTDTYTGAGLLGGIDTSKYEGPLVRIELLKDLGFSVQEYYTRQASLSFNGETPIEQAASPASGCIIDSGAVGDKHNPVDHAAYFNVTGLRLNPSYSQETYLGNYVSWPDRCENIPADKFFEHSFAGVREGERAVVKVPLRAYARFQDPVDEAIGWCTMAITLNNCGYNSPFLSAAFFAADDERGEIAIAQGGVAEPGSGIDYSSVVARIP